jgi:mono/diheme cytochrome c family protein
MMIGMPAAARSARLVTVPAPARSRELCRRAQRQEVQAPLAAAQTSPVSIRLQGLRRGSRRNGLAGAVCLAAVAFTAGCHQNKNLATSSSNPHGQLDFNQDVQPILAANCFSCHGPDPEMRKAGLRLDLADTAFKKRPGHPDAIVPGHPEQSELIKRIESKDPHHLMPQTSLGEAKPMKAADIAVLREWVKEGAVYRPHWAFEKPTLPKVPALTPTAAAGNNQPWGNNAIDSFVLARLRKEGLHPSPEADKATLIRRVTLDLTGLLPTPAEVRAFQADKSPQAYEHLVDNLLARPTYGEQRARYWLDYARYADTYGIHLDNSRDIWPYRDYVIRSFNSNKPFDQFTMEQIAGDLMPAKTLDPLIASGYVRLGVSSNEGGAIPEELRANIARERAEAYGAAFMGLTVGCAVCHDHKYDPTTQKDFYALTAFFNNIDEKPFNGDRPVWTPMARIPRPQNQQAYDRVLAQRSELAAQLATLRAQLPAHVREWLASHQRPPLAVSTDKLDLRLRLDEGGGDVLRNSAPHPQQASFPIGKFKPQWGETTWLWPDFRIDASTHILLGQTGDYEQSQAFSSGGWFMMRSAPNYTLENASGALISKMDSTQHNRGWDLSMTKGIVDVELVNQGPQDLKPLKPPADKSAKPKPIKEVFEYPTPADLTAKDLAPNRPKEVKKAVKKDDKKPRTEPVTAKNPSPKPFPARPAEDSTPLVALRVATAEPLPLDGHWRHIFFTYDGSGSAAGVKIYVDGKPVATTVISDTLAKETIRTSAPMQLGWRSPDADPAREARFQDIRVYARPLKADEVQRLPFEDFVAEVAAKPADKWTEDEAHATSEFYFNTVEQPAIALQKEIAQLDAQLEKLSEGGDLTMVSWERPSIAYANILTRGVYTARAARVEADTPHFLPPLPANEPHNRLALAKWTVSPDNPLTARVTVNRMWNELFGTGIVETTEDFGIMGQRPSNPELLDWLAVEFRQSGWNVKHMYKLMVMSAAYRQVAKSTPEQLQRDPRNLLLSHGPRFRMDGEMVRDVALESSGLLVSKIGGPSVKGYQPPNIWEHTSHESSDTLHYVQDHGDALYRRSMYSYWKRMSIMPDMDAFDAPMRDVACTRRQRTDTPLQALVTLDDEQWVEAARGLAERVIREGGKQPAQRIDLMSEILLAHDPPPNTEKVLADSLSQMEKHYSAQPKAAEQLIAVGEKKATGTIPAPELAAWTMIASEMLNLDETLNK